jgi:hypothetical protein
MDGSTALLWRNGCLMKRLSSARRITARKQGQRKSRCRRLTALVSLYEGKYFNESRAP